MTAGVFLVDPHREGLIVVVPDAAGVRPVVDRSRGQEQGRHGLMEEEVVVDELLLLLLGHALERAVPAGQVTGQAPRSFHRELLDGTALPAAAVRGRQKARMPRPVRTSQLST